MFYWIFAEMTDIVFVLVRRPQMTLLGGRNPTQTKSGSFTIMAKKKWQIVTIILSIVSALKYILIILFFVLFSQYSFSGCVLS